jgi:sugar lactone lactonase YvrE
MTFAMLRVAGLLMLVGVWVGCASMPLPPAGRRLEIAGTVHGGQQPVTGSAIQLYAVGTTGDGSAATALLTSPVMTDADGSFSLSGLFTCSAAGEDVYLVSTGGNPGLSPGTNNAAIAMMASLGPCGGLGPTTFISLNELTTVGSVAALYPFMNSYATVGSGASDAMQFGAALRAVNDYTNTASGAVPGPTLPAGYYASSVEIRTLADVISGCINSGGGVAGDGTECGRLFTLTTPPGSGIAATDTVGAVLNVLRNPTNNVAGIYNVLPPRAPFLPALTGPPASWNLPIVAPPAAASPTFSPAGGYTAATPVQVTLNSATAGAAIYYTLDGSTPTIGSARYAGSVAVTGYGEVLNAVAMAVGSSPSGVASATYYIGTPPAATPVLAPGGGTYRSAQTVTMKAATSTCGHASTPGIYYAIEGGPAVLYSAPVQVAASETISAYVTNCAGFGTSATATASYSILPYGVISTIAGTGTTGYTGDGGQGSAAEVNAPFGVAVDGNGNVYVADTFNCRVRKVTSAGVISKFAGTGQCGYNGDGQPASGANLSYPYGVAVDANGTVYIADYANARVRKVDTLGMISTVAGTGAPGFSGDSGQAMLAQISYPYGVAVDAAGDVYLSDSGNQRIRKVSAAGVISTVAGNGTAGFSGDGGAATNAELNAPFGIAVDGKGTLYIADVQNMRVRKVTAAGVISTAAGTGVAGFTGDGGAAASAQLKEPNGVAVDAGGNVYVADLGNARVRKVAAGMISTVAGGGSAGPGDGGLATAAQVVPYGIAADGAGNLYVSDTYASVVRAVVYQAAHP